MAARFGGAKEYKYAALTDAFEGAFGENDDAMLFSCARTQRNRRKSHRPPAWPRARGGGNDGHPRGGRAANGLDRTHSLAGVHAALCFARPSRRRNQGEENASEALVRGIAERLCNDRTQDWRMFDAVTASDVPKGSGLSSSAAFSILVATIVFSELFNDGQISPVEQALASKYAENNHFGKPSGLMDQLACAVGGFITIDFEHPEQPKIERIDCDLAALGYAISALSTAAATTRILTPEYAAVTREMGSVAQFFRKNRAARGGRVKQNSMRRWGSCERSVSDRALLRAMHFLWRQCARTGAGRRAEAQGYGVRFAGS